MLNSSEIATLSIREKERKLRNKICNEGLCKIQIGLGSVEYSYELADDFQEIFKINVADLLSSAIVWFHEHTITPDSKFDVVMNVSKTISEQEESFTIKFVKKTKD